MKSLLILTLMAIAPLAASPKYNLPTNQGLDMYLTSEIEFQEKVKIYDYHGNLLNEYLLDDVVNNNITLSDHFIIEQSDFAFDHLGDYYYFSKELTPLGVN